MNFREVEIHKCGEIWRENSQISEKIGVGGNSHTPQEKFRTPNWSGDLSLISFLALSHS